MPSWTSPVGTLACWCAYVPGDCHVILSVNWARGAIALSGGAEATLARLKCLAAL